MRLVVISDTHNRMSEIHVPAGDVLIHCGDACSRGSNRELGVFNRYFLDLPHKYKIFVPGNHDKLFERDLAVAKSFFNSSVNILIDEPLSIEGIKFYGSPWTPRFFDWSYNLDRGAELKKKWDLIPDKLDVLITHGPPHGILDQVSNGKHVGCEELLKRVQQVKPKYHLFGHIHESHGVVTLGTTTYVNATICDSEQRPVFKAVVVDL